MLFWKVCHKTCLYSSVVKLLKSSNINSEICADIQKPIFTHTNMNGTTRNIETGKGTRFECVIHGYPKPQITWYKVIFRTVLHWFSNIRSTDINCHYLLVFQGTEN